MADEDLDVAVVGGGPTGINACLQLSRRAGLTMALFESETELGGIPRSCHIIFGLRDMKRLLSGPTYARKLTSLIRNTAIAVHTNATVLAIDPDVGGDRHLVKVSSPRGITNYRCRFVLLATGCYEQSREARRIPGSRPSGVFTTGSLQQLVNLQRQKPGQRAVIIGSEHVAFSCALTLRRAGVPVAALVEEDTHLSTYRLPAMAISHWLGFPTYRNMKPIEILGKRRVEALKLLDKKSEQAFCLDCDTVVFTGKFRPDAALIYKTSIDEDPASLGPVVDMDYMTTVPNIFAAGNVLRGADMHDICALEGRKAAQNILRIIDDKGRHHSKYITINPEYPIRFVVPQRLIVQEAPFHRASLFVPGVSMQLTHSVKKCTIEAWSGQSKVWSRHYPRLLGNTRIPLPVERFDWSSINPTKPITVKMHGEKNRNRE